MRSCIMRSCRYALCVWGGRGVFGRGEGGTRQPWVIDPAAVKVLLLAPGVITFRGSADIRGQDGLALQDGNALSHVACMYGA
jgi:hypothetical protein